MAPPMLEFDCMKLPIRLRKVDWLGIEVDLELLLGGIGAVLILRWLMY
jgi:hypothetical protein